jgi:cell wall-associated NlpC family hydrolase
MGQRPEVLWSSRNRSSTIPTRVVPVRWPSETWLRATTARVGGPAQKDPAPLSPVRNLLRALVVTGLTAVLVAPAASARAEPSVAELTKQINTASEKLVEIVESHNKLREEIKETKRKAADINRRLGPLEKQLEESRAEITALANQVYKTGGMDMIGALLSVNDSDSLLNRLGTLNRLARDRERQLATYSATHQRYTQEKAELELTLARQQAQSKELTARKKKIEAERDKLYRMREAAYGSATNPGSPYTGPIPSISGNAGVAVSFAYGAIGKPYVWGAAGPNGYDCSGLTLAAWRAAGKSLPHNAAMQWNMVARIDRASLQPGDLVFYNGLNHVGIYVGNNQIIHAPTFGEPVTLAPIGILPLVGYGRVR